MSATRQLPDWAEDVLRDLPDLLTVKEVAAALRLPVPTVRTYLRTGKLQRIRFGGPGCRLRIIKASVAQLLAAGGGA